MKHIVQAALVSLLAFAAAPCHAGAPQPQEAKVIAVTATDTKASLILRKADSNITKSIDATEFLELAKTLNPGDTVRVTLTEDDPPKLTALSVKSVQMDAFTRSGALALAFALLAALAGVATKGRLLQLFIGADNRASDSQTQLVMWTAMALSAYLATLFLRYKAGGLEYLGGVGITENLLAISGLSAISFGAAKAVAVAKTNDPDAPITAQALKPKLRDLVQNDDGKFDLGDFQMIAVTLISVVTYFWIVFHFLGTIDFTAKVMLPDVDGTLLAAFGLGQGAYLAKKAALPAGKG